jgi:MFS family permease
LAAILLSQYLISSFFQPVASAMIADILPPKERSNGYALMRMAGNIGWGTGPAIGGFLFDVSYQSLFYFTSVTFLVSGVVVLLTVKETVGPTLRQTSARPKERQGFAAMAAAFKRDKVFLFFCMVALLLFLTWGQFVSTLSVFMKKEIGLSSTQIGWLYAFNALLVIVFQYIVTQKTKHKNHFILMMVGSILFVASYAVMGWISSFGMMMLIMVFITFGEMFAGPSGNTIASNMANGKQYGKYQGIYSSISTLGWSLGPFIGGIMMDLIPNMKLFWLSMSSFGLLAFFGFLYLYYKKGEHAA